MSAVSGSVMFFSLYCLGSENNCVQLSMQPLPQAFSCADLSFDGSQAWGSQENTSFSFRIIIELRESVV